jgi:hypothetical protein
VKIPQDGGGRMALGLGVVVVLGGAGTLARAASLRHQMETEGVPATKEWAVALRSAQRPDELTGAGISFVVAGVALVAWALLRASRS